MTGPIIPADQWPEGAVMHVFTRSGEGAFMWHEANELGGWSSHAIPSGIPMPAGHDWRVPVMRPSEQAPAIDLGQFRDTLERAANVLRYAAHPQRSPHADELASILVRIEGVSGIDTALADTLRDALAHVGLPTSGIPQVLADRCRMALIDGQTGCSFPWENFPAYLLDKCEGDTISEEGLQRAAADMAKDPRYAMQPTKGDGQVNVRSSSEHSDSLIARPLAEWHEDFGPVMWWAWRGSDWAGEPAWCGTPNDGDWPGYHTHWTPHPAMPMQPTKGEGE